MENMKYTARWECPVYYINEDTGREEEIYSRVGEKQFNNIFEAIAWLGDKDNDYHYSCVVYRNDNGRIVHVGWLA